MFNSVKNQMRNQVFNSVKKSMKRTITTIVLGCIFFTAVESFAQGKFQLRNGDFEAPFVPAQGASATGTEPPHWQSFGSLTGSQASLARSGAQIAHSNDTDTVLVLDFILAKLKREMFCSELLRMEI
jgi:hypothetical protein